jgi:hypothetical protein
MDENKIQVQYVAMNTGHYCFARSLQQVFQYQLYPPFPCVSAIFSHSAAHDAPVLANSLLDSR